MIRQLLIALTLVATFINFSNAQGELFGKEFWCGFTYNEMGDPVGRVYLYSEYATKVTLTLTSEDSVITVNLSPFKVAHVDLLWSLFCSKTPEVVVRTGIHIVSDKPIMVVATLREVHATNTYPVLPLKQIKKKDRHVANFPKGQGRNQIMLLATEDSVLFKVTLTEYSYSWKHHPYVPFEIWLNRGETYTINCGTGTFSGSEIEILNDKKGYVYLSDKQIDFLYGGCGHRSAITNLNGTDWVDNKYVVLPYFGQDSGYRVQCVSLDSQLWVDVNGFSYLIEHKDSAVDLNIFDPDSVLVIQASRPFLCFQYMKGGGKNGFYKKNSGGHPGWIQLAGSRHRTPESSIISLPNTKNTDHFITILIPSQDVHQTFLDGVQIPYQDFTPVKDDTSLSYARMIVGEGVHKISNPNGHQVFSYGLEISGVAESYYYFASFKPPYASSFLKDKIVSYRCDSGYIEAELNLELFVSYNEEVQSLKWYSDDFMIPDSTINFTGRFNPGKNYDFTIVVQFLNHTDTLKESFIFNYPVFNPISDAALCKDSVTYGITDPYFRNIRWHDNGSERFKVIKDTGSIWVSAQDLSGHCKYFDSAHVEQLIMDQKVLVDTLSDCIVNNLFRFEDLTTFQTDSVRLRVWSFNNEIVGIDTHIFSYKFPLGGKVAMSLDLHLEKSDKKCRIDIPVYVNWNTYTRAQFDKDRYCDGDTITVVDQSRACCDSMKYYSVFSDGFKMSSVNPLLRFVLHYDYTNNIGFRKVFYEVENDKGCKDTFVKELYISPVAKPNFSLDYDGPKCLTLSRWTFTHNVDESLTGPYDVKWDFGNGKTSDIPVVKNFRYFDTGTYVAKLYTTTNLGCRDSFWKSIEVWPEPSFELLPKDSLFCLKKQGELQLTATYQHAAIEKLSWYNGREAKYGDTFSIKADAAPLHQVNVETVLNTTYCSKFKRNKDFYLYAQPEPVLELSDTQFCIGEILWAYDRSSPDTNITRNWYVNDSFSGQQLVLEQEQLKVGNFSMKLKLTGNAHCFDSVSQNFVVHALPSAKIKGDSLYCFGESAEFEAEVQAQHFHWSDEKGWIQSDIEKLQILHPPIGTQWVKLNFENSEGCRDSVIQYYQVFEGPEADFTINRDTQCYKEQDFVFSNNTQTSGDPQTSWKFVAGTDKSFEGQIWDHHQFDLPGENEVRLIVSTAAGCIDSVVKHVFVSNIHKPRIIGDTICDLEYAQLEAINHPDDVLNRIEWNLGDGTSKSGNPVNHIYSETGKYSIMVEIENAHGCLERDTLSNGVQVKPLPLSAFDASWEWENNEPSRIHLLANQQGADRYEWYIDEAYRSEGETHREELMGRNQLLVKLVVSNIPGCTSFTEKQFIKPMSNWLVPTAFSPNYDGINDVFNIVPVRDISEYSIKIYNRWGEQVFGSQHAELGWEASDMLPGMYLYIIQFRDLNMQLHVFKGMVQLIR